MPVDIGGRKDAKKWFCNWLMLNVKLKMKNGSDKSAAAWNRKTRVWSMAETVIDWVPWSSGWGTQLFVCKSSDSIRQPSKESDRLRPASSTRMRSPRRRWITMQNASRCSKHWWWGLNCKWRPHERLNRGPQYTFATLGANCQEKRILRDWHSNCGIATWIFWIWK